MPTFSLGALPLLLAAGAPAQASEGYLRTPDLHGEDLVFVAEGDLWTVSVEGGKARRLTTHAGTEMLPRFSADGSQILFMASYGGSSDLYTISLEGGEPRRLTWSPGRETVVDWLPDGDILYASSREEPHGRPELYRLSPEGGDAEKLPLGWAAWLAEDPDSGLWAFNRISREFRTWKRYRGGTAQNIWVGHPDKKDFQQITDFSGTDSLPMWHEGRIWFASDFGGTMNLWSMEPDGSDRSRHTDHEEWDLRWPSMGDQGRIVYMLAGQVWLHDIEAGESRRVDIQLPSELVRTRNRHIDTAWDMTWATISPNGKRVAYTTRGEVFTIPVDEGVTLPVTRTSGVRESWAEFSPDGEELVYISDAGGEESLRIRDAWGRGEETVLREAAEEGWNFWPRWAPEGDHIAWADGDLKLWVTNKRGKVKLLDQGTQDEIRDYTWSPDGRYLAYSKSDSKGYRSIFVAEARSGEIRQVTPSTTDDHSPSWDPSGRYLYFLGNRNPAPVLGAKDFEYVVLKPTQLFLILLQEEEENPFLKTAGKPLERGEEEEEDEETDEEEEDEEEEEEDDKIKVKIDWEDLEERVLRLPISSGRYSSPTAHKSGLFYMDYTDGNRLMKFSLDDDEPSSFADDIWGYELALEGDHIMLMKGGQISVVGSGSAPGATALSEGRIDESGLVMDLDPQEEWTQMFREAWRHMRDFHWDPELGGLDWDAIYEQYASVLPRIASRSDLQDLLGEMIGELATSHTYVYGGDFAPGGGWVPAGLLGADLVREGSAYRVEHILHGAANDGMLSPLSVPGEEVEVGEYIHAVNHRSFEDDWTLEQALEGMAGIPVMLTVSSSVKERKARQVVVTPMYSDRSLRYVDWVRTRRELVDELSGGRFGYVHIPDMGMRGLTEFEKWFAPQLDKEGMVVDARWNGGGFVSQLIVERLRRPLTSVNRSAAGGVSTYPAQVLNGPFIVLTNEHAGSDGDIFPATIQSEGLAPVLGMRSWGGVVGIRSDKGLVDGGVLTQPEYAFFGLGTKSGWTVENHGVDPDIEVQNLPQELGEGIDRQLIRAVEELEKLHEQNPPWKPEFGPGPIKTRESFREQEGG